MSNNIGKNELNNFFIQKLHTNKVSIEDAKKLGINVEEFKDADVNDDNCFDIDEITDVKDLYAASAPATVAPAHSKAVCIKLSLHAEY